MSYLDMARSILNGLPAVAHHDVIDTPCEKSEISEMRSNGTSAGLTNEAVVWRVAAFRDRLPAQGPIWPPKLRDTPATDTPGHCSLCGDALPTDPAPPPRFPRCQPCITALWLALSDARGEGMSETEGVP